MDGMGIVYMALLIPLVVTGIFYLIKKHEFTWWEFFVPIVAVGLTILINVKISEKAATNFTEYWGSTVTHVIESEPYNYWQHQTCTRTSTDSKGNTTTTTYDCSHQEDVGPQWYAITNLDEKIVITEKLHDELVAQFGTGKVVKKTRKNHSSRSRAVGSKGTKFQGTKVGKTSAVLHTKWGGQDNTRKAYVSQHTYENRIKASDLSIFNIEVVKRNMVDSLGLYKYPIRGSKNQTKTKTSRKGVTKYGGWEFPTIIGDSTVSEATQEKFRKLNGKYGVSNQMRLWILVFEDADPMTGVMQENYWVRGNMNELVLCIGKSGEEVQWAHAFSWATSNTLTVEVRNAVLDLYTYKDTVIAGQKLPVLEIGMDDQTKRVKSSSTPVLTEQTWDDLYVWMNDNLQDFERRTFDEFEYVKVVPSKKAKIFIYILALVIAIGVNIWVTTNDIYEGNENNNKRKTRYGSRRFY